MNVAILPSTEDYSYKSSQPRFSVFDTWYVQGVKTPLVCRSATDLAGVRFLPSRFFDLFYPTMSSFAPYVA